MIITVRKLILSLKQANIMTETNAIIEEEKLKKVRIKLKPRNEKFCHYYAITGNATQSYMQAYSIKDQGSYYGAASSANKLLKNPKVCERINQLLEKSGFNDEGVDTQLNFLINQHEDKKTKLGAIKEYNNLKKRTGQNKSVFQGNTFNLTQMLDKANQVTESVKESDQWAMEED